MNVLRALVLLAAAWLAGLAAIDTASRDPEARTSAINFVLEKISEGMRGSMRVQEVTSLSLDTWTVAARDFRVWDENGAEVLHVEHAAVALDPWALLGGDVRITRARGVRGQLEITQRADEEIGLDRAFQGASQGGGPSFDPVVRFDRLDVVNVRVHISARGADMVAGRVYGEIRLAAGAGVATRLRMRRVRGNVQIREPVPADLRVVWLRGRFDSQATRRFDARASTRFLGDPLEGRVGIVVDPQGRSRFVAEADGEGFFGDMGDALVGMLAGL